MSAVRLPLRFRPHCFNRRKVERGLDLPSSFIDSLRQIDSGFYPIFHKYRVLWDSIINCDYGQIEESRYQINCDFGELNFGFVLTNGKGYPLEDGTFHIWRLCETGWAHILKLESTEGEYLNLVLHRLNLQAEHTNKYGFRSYNRLLESLREEDQLKLQRERQALFQATQDENAWLMKRVADNFGSGVTKPTHPHKDVIVSYKDQSNRSRLRVPLSDEDAGIKVVSK